MKFSIIVPVYNTSDYLIKCFDSIVNQTYQNYEVIIINDGSTDNSQTIINEYKNKYPNFKSYQTKYNGVSEARNIGIKKATGDYLVFVDSDDFVEKELLKKINEHLIYENVDILKYQGQKVFDEKKEIINGSIFDTTNPTEIFETLVKDSMFQPIWLYAINLKFYKKNRFEFAKGKLHEDLGLIPYIIIKAHTIKSIDYIGYNYYRRSGSIVNNKTISYNLKKATDVLWHYDNLMKLINHTNIDKKTKKIFKSFLANEVILKAKTLDISNYKKFVEEIKVRKVTNQLLNNNLKRLLKKMYLSLFLELVIKKSVKGNKVNG